MSITLEDFEILPVAGSQTPSNSVDRAVAETEKAASYEQGYQAGWDDAARAEAEDQARIGVDFANNLQELSFTFHEARAHVIQTLEPLLNELVDKLLPDVVCESMGLWIVNELRPLIEAGADCPIQLVVAPASRLALETRLSQSNFPTLELVEESALAEGQAFLRVGKVERKIDLASALERISTAMRSLHDLNERTLKHG